MIHIVHKRLQITITSNRVFSHVVMAATVMSQNNEKAAMLVSQANPVGVELFSHVNALFCSNTFICMTAGYATESNKVHVLLNTVTAHKSYPFSLLLIFSLGSRENMIRDK